MSITDQELKALRNLSKKQSGEDVDFINIADARALTELGLATRNQQGWAITEAGAAILTGTDKLPEIDDGETSVTPFPTKPAA
jgi:hypothetical protein